MVENMANVDKLLFIVEGENSIHFLERSPQMLGSTGVGQICIGSESEGVVENHCEVLWKCGENVKIEAVVVVPRNGTSYLWQDGAWEELRNGTPTILKPFQVTKFKCGQVVLSLHPIEDLESVQCRLAAEEMEKQERMTKEKRSSLSLDATLLVDQEDDEEEENADEDDEVDILKDSRNTNPVETIEIDLNSAAQSRVGPGDTQIVMGSDTEDNEEDAQTDTEGNARHSYDDEDHHIPPTLAPDDDEDQEQDQEEAHTDDELAATQPSSVTPVKQISCAEIEKTPQFPPTDKKAESTNDDTNIEETVILDRTIRKGTDSSDQESILSHGRVPLDDLDEVSSAVTEKRADKTPQRSRRRRQREDDSDDSDDIFGDLDGSDENERGAGKVEKREQQEYRKSEAPADGLNLKASIETATTIDEIDNGSTADEDEENSLQALEQMRQEAKTLEEFQRWAKKLPTSELNIRYDRCLEDQPKKGRKARTQKAKQIKVAEYNYDVARFSQFLLIELGEPFYRFVRDCYSAVDKANLAPSKEVVNQELHEPTAFIRKHIDILEAGLSTGLRIDNYQKKFLQETIASPELSTELPPIRSNGDPQTPKPSEVAEDLLSKDTPSPSRKRSRKSSRSSPSNNVQSKNGADVASETEHIENADESALGFTNKSKIRKHDSREEVDSPREVDQNINADVKKRQKVTDEIRKTFQEEKEDSVVEEEVQNPSPSIRTRGKRKGSKIEGGKEEVEHRKPPKRSRSARKVEPNSTLKTEADTNSGATLQAATPVSGLVTGGAAERVKSKTRSPAQGSGTNPRIMFTGVEMDDAIRKQVESIKGTIVNSIPKATHLVVWDEDGKFKRTAKVLEALAIPGNDGKGIRIVNKNWLHDCSKNRCVTSSPSCLEYAPKGHLSDTEAFDIGNYLSWRDSQTNPLFSRLKVLAVGSDAENKATNLKDALKAAGLLLINKKKNPGVPDIVFAEKKSDIKGGNFPKYCPVYNIAWFTTGLTNNFPLKVDDGPSPFKLR